ncbi:uncharacterized protein DDB_G0287625 [Phoenix dactylifera]|uniref:Uncharacterized protein DDB_G0287625 n=1 Tax=Phoenix dactylifera TaxID=42345 RepID=A0A8B7D124_PHODC|nr:uncharacterized protein DDB_G0287625 [Phoenix dactylifera]
MRPALSSKHPKKNADEKRIKKKKMKSNKRRRHNSSSSSSYSSNSEIDARSRKKSVRREPQKPEKRRKEPKKLVKKKSRKTYYRRDSSASSPSSYSSRSCSTCRARSSSVGRSESGSGRSRSPPGRAKRRAKLRERSRSKSPPGRKAKLGGRSRSRSPLDGAVRRVKSRERSRSKSRERGRSRRSSQRTNYERDDGRYCENSSSHSSRGYNRSWSYNEGKCKEVDQPRRLKSTLVVTKESEGMEEGLRSRDKIVQAYDDVGRNFDAHEQASEDRQVDLGGAKHATDTGVEDVACAKGDKYVLTKLDGEPSKNADVGSDDSTRKNSGDAVNAGNSESEDLELQLRQKALENFRKFRGGLSVNASTSSDRKDDSLLTESCKDAGRLVEAKDAIILSKWKSNNSLQRQGSIQRGSCTTQPRIRSVVNIPTEHDDRNSIISHQNAKESSRPAADGQTTSNHLKSMEEPLDKVSSGKILLPKDIQDRKAAAEPRSSTTIGTELKIADGSTSGASACLSVESGNKPVEVDTTGSNFEQKSFSRMHDGEMVQVSYKVYIPKKSPALARRQLQR